MIEATLSFGNAQQRVNIPTCWADVKFKDFYRIQQLGDQPDIFELYSILLGCEVAHVRNMSIKSFEFISAHFNFITVAADVDAKEADKVLTIDGKVWSYCYDMEQETVGCYQDWKAELAELNETDPYALMPLTLAYFVRPVGEQYDFTKVPTRVDTFTDLSCLTVLRLSNFFFLRTTALQKNMRAYSLSLTLTNRLRVWLNSVYLVFTLPFTLLLGAISLLWMKLPVKRLARYLCSFFTRNTSTSTKKD